MASVGPCLGLGVIFWETRALQPCHVRAQAGFAPVKPAAPPVVAPHRAPILPVALAGALAYRPCWIARRERFFLGPFQGVLQSFPVLIQLAGISSAARCAARSRSWREMGLAVARGILCWDSGSHRGWTVPFWALLLSCRAARVHMWVWVGAKPCPGCNVPITSVPRPSPAAPLVQLAPQNPWLGVSEGVLHLPKLSPNFAFALLESPV